MVLLQALAWKEFSEAEIDDTEILAGWLIRITPLRLLRQLSNLWKVIPGFAHSQELGSLLTMDGFGHSDIIFPQLRHHRSALVSERHISAERLAWQVSIL
jgi:hypothetical protein